jgi:hypothetical protein
VRCHITVSIFPTLRRIRICRAIPGRGIFDAAVAAFALLHDLMANPAVKRASLRVHERALFSVSNRFADQFNHLLSIIDFLKKKPGENHTPADFFYSIKTLEI